jgi:light-regulated signal transduction histidine kinase (bacteriophytochrome)
MFLAALGLLWMIRSWLDRAVLIYMAGSIGATVVSELFFAAYSSVTGPANLAGHLLRAVAFYLVYKALIEAGLDRPFEVLFRLARSNQDLEQFAHMASHDLKAPLRMISGFMDLLQERVAEKLDAKALGYIEYAAGSVLRMQQLLDDLLENALKFGGDRKPEVHLGARRVDGEWEFSVRDHGIGIDLAYRDQICIIFQRLHAADRHPGSGVGLAICKKIVERQGGRIWVESAPGEGATFRFTFPAGA